MNYIFDGSITCNFKDSPDTSVTVFRKKEDRWEKLIDPFYAPETKNLPKIEDWRNTTTISIALNHPIGDKTCTVKKIENGTNKGPDKVGNFKWEIEITSTKEKMSGPNTTIEVEVAG